MNKTIACCLVGLILAIAIEVIYLEWEPPSPPGVTEHQYNRQEAAGPKPPALAGQAQGNLDASYTISFARIPVGEITATVVFGDSEYAISARARAGGVMKVLSVDGEGSFTTRGTIKDGHPVPTNFTSKIVSNTETSDVTMALDEGSVRELAATPPPSQDRVPVTAANRQGIVDPLTAVLFSTAAAGETLSQDACRRTLPIFDGHQRYDLKLAFKRMDKVTAEKGYAGPVVVCSVSYEPIAGHASIPLVKYLSEGREMEMALAPIAGTRLLAPFQLSVVSMLANLTIEANRLETTAPPLDAERALEQATAIPSSPSLAREPVDRQEVMVAPSPPALASERALEQATAIPSSPSLAREPVDRQEVTVSSSPPALAGERALEQATAIPSSPSLAREPVDRQEVTVSSSPPALAGERALEQATAIPSSPSLAREPVDRQEVMVAPSPPALASERALEQATAIPSSLSLAQERVDRQEVMVSSSPPALASERALEQATAIPSSPSLARDQSIGKRRWSHPAHRPGERSRFGTGGGDIELTFARTGTSRSARGDGLIQPTGCERTRFGAGGGDTELTFARTKSSWREEAMVPPSFPRIAQKQVDQKQPVTESSLPAFAKRQLDPEEIAVLLKRGKDLIAHGDIAAARVTLKRAAEANDAEAALALASTYDPFVLRELKVYGFSADAAMARAWYEKAKDLGSAVAPRRLEMLAREAR